MPTVRTTTIINGVLSTDFENADTIDGVTLATGDFILIKNQTTATENGVYIVNVTGTPTRAQTWRIGVGVSGKSVNVREGNTNANTGWLCTNVAGSDIVGTDNLTFSRIIITNAVGTDSLDTMTNKNFVTTNNDFIDGTDSTKKINFSTSGATTSTATTLASVQTGNRTLTLPDATDTLTVISATQTLSNKKLVDANTTIVDEIDDTKALNFQLSGATASTTTTIASSQTGNRTITLPDVTDTLAGTTATQNLSNKTLLDSGVKFGDQADTTKSLNFSLGGATTASTMTITSAHTANRTLTLPDATDTFAILSATQTLTNKTITAGSNTVSSNNLKTTGADVNVVLAPPPILGQVLQATAPTTATWQYRGWRNPVRVATTVAGVLATDFENLDIVDGISLATGNRILIKNQSNSIENGIYTVNTSGSPTRASDYATGSSVSATFMITQEGTSNADTLWICTNNNSTDIVNTNNLAYAQIGGGGGSGDVTGPASSLDQEIVRFNGTGGKTIEGAGVRNYGASATDPTVPTPQAGDQYYNTAINHDMRYDGSRSKWLSVAVLYEGCGRNGNVNSGVFYRRFNGMVLTNTTGPHVAKGTIIRIGYTTSTAVAHTLEIRVSGATIATLTSGGAASAFSDTVNADFNAGNMSMLNQVGSSTTNKLQSVIYYKLRV